jgi:hypothetical protein
MAQVLDLFCTAPGSQQDCGTTVIVLRTSQPSEEILSAIRHAIDGDPHACGTT